VGLELRKVDFDDLVVLGILVCAKVVSKGGGVFGDLRAFGGIEVLSHTRVEGEERGCCANFSTHVADSSHARAGQRFNTWALVLDDGTSATLDR
jgi:hypothetical protein